MSNQSTSTAAPTVPPVPHLLSLKVLRAAKPSSSKSTINYSYETSNSLIAAKAISNLEQEISLAKRGYKEFSLNGNLQLPSTFGTIFLGESFSALISISNDSIDLSSSALLPVLKVEMHTSGSPTVPGQKHSLLTLNSEVDIINGNSIEGMVSHEIKELGMHALVCTVSYGVRSPERETTTRTFRKIFKFEVSNPLSVRTKAHSPHPNTATSNLSATEREKVFLEVQVQNQTQNSIYFQRMNFEPTPAFTSIDINYVTPSSAPSSTSTTATQSSTTHDSIGLFESTSALLPMGGVRQYLYILSPTINSIPALPGPSQPLGRLDIQWRTPNGEFGKLQTSMLGRRVPIPITPLHLLVPSNSSSVATGEQNQSPPLPLKDLHTSPPSNHSMLLPNSPIIQLPDDSNLSFDLTVLKNLPSRKVSRDEIFEIKFNLEIKDRSLLVPPNSNLSSLHTSGIRKLKVIAQFVKWTDHSNQLPSPASSNLENNPNLLVLPRPIRVTSAILAEENNKNNSNSIRNPKDPSPSHEIIKLGSTTIELEPFEFDFDSNLSTISLGSPPESQVPILVSKGVVKTISKEFSMKFLALGSSTDSTILRVGGIRILLLESSWSNELANINVLNLEEGMKIERRAKVVLELGTVAEVLIG